MRTYSTDEVETINAWSQSWADLVGALLWQSTMWVLVVATVAVTMRRASPRLLFWLWQLVAIKLLLMPFWTFAATTAPLEPPRHADLLGLSWQSLLFGVWRLVYCRDPADLAPGLATRSSGSTPRASESCR